MLEFVQQIDKPLLSCGDLNVRGKLVDAYRYLHKEKDMECGFSWSGHPIGKYRGKRMRIDYFIVSARLKDTIVSCEMHGHGIELEDTWALGQRDHTHSRTNNLLSDSIISSTIYSE